MEVVAGLGRVPDPDEFPGAAALTERFGSLKRAFAAVQRLTGTEAWDDIARRRREDILVYLALSRFRKRPAISLLPLTLQRDMKAFFGAYTKACAEADALLFKAGDSSAIDEACKKSAVGKLLPDDLYVHRTALDSLDVSSALAWATFAEWSGPGRVGQFAGGSGRPVEPANQEGR